MTETEAFPPSNDQEIAQATSALFADIAHATGNPTLTAMMERVNAHMVALRGSETPSVPDLVSEFEALSDAWKRRDLPRLNVLLAAYFQRRKNAAAEIAKRIDSSH